MPTATKQTDIDLEAIKARGRRDPVWFIQDVLRVPYLTPDQRKVCRSLRDNRRTAVPAGNGVGKTFLAACIVLWFLFCFVDSKVLTTAPTWFQVENLLWREVRAILSRSALAGSGQATLTSLTLSNEWFAVGLSTNDPTRFQGIHAPFVLIVFDEATGVSGEIWEAAEGVAVGDADVFLAIGNPTDPTARFKQVCDSPLWNVVRLSGENHPNVLEGREVVAGAVTRSWIDEKLIEYGGRDSAFYRARVLGLFPEQGDDMLISLTDVERAQADYVAPQTPLTTVGCDVARFGSDETVLCKLHGETVGAFQSWRGQDTMATAGALKALAGARLGVDDSGLGGGVTDRLREQGVSVVAVNAGETAREPDRFVNARAEMWWLIRLALQENRLRLPPDTKLAADLTNVKFTYDSRGRIKLESKDEIKKRLGRSTDRGDALAIALYAQTTPVVVRPLRRNYHTTQTL